MFIVVEIMDITYVSFLYLYMALCLQHNLVVVSFMHAQ